MVKSIDISYTSTEFLCNGCVLGKITRYKVNKASSDRASQPLRLVRSDILVHLELFLAVVLDTVSSLSTNLAVQYNVRQISNSFKCFKAYKSYADNSTSTTTKRKRLNMHENSSFRVWSSQNGCIKALISNNREEYISNEFKSFLHDNIPKMRSQSPTILNKMLWMSTWMEHS